MLRAGKSRADDTWLDSDHRYHRAFRVAGGDEKRMNRLMFGSNDGAHEEPHKASYSNTELLDIQVSSCTSRVCVTG